MYDELVYFDGAHFAHISAWLEHRRMERKRLENASAMRRHTLRLRYA